MCPRTITSILQINLPLPGPLGPALCNGGWHFMSLTTSFRILQYKWTVLPVTSDVITRVHELAFPTATNASPPLKLLAFTWTDGSVVTPVSSTPEGALDHHTPDHSEISEDLSNIDDMISSTLNHHTSDHSEISKDFSNSDDIISSTTELPNNSHDASSRASEHDSSTQDTSEDDFSNQDQIKSDLLQDIQHQTDIINQLEQNFEAEYNDISDNLNAPKYESDNNSDTETDQRSEQQFFQLKNCKTKGARQLLLMNAFKFLRIKGARYLPILTKLKMKSSHTLTPITCGIIHHNLHKQLSIVKLMTALFFNTPEMCQTAFLTLLTV